MVSPAYGREGYGLTYGQLFQRKLKTFHLLGNRQLLSDMLIHTVYQMLAYISTPTDQNIMMPYRR